jgi:hypothetical protein
MEKFHGQNVKNAANIDEFELFRLEQLAEKKRKSNRAALIIFPINIILSGLLVLLDFYTVAFFVLPAVGVFIFFVYRDMLNIKYSEKFKESLLKKLFELSAPEFQYFPNSFVTDTLFIESGFVKRFSKYSGEDLFKGIVNEIPVEFSEIKVSIKATRYQRKLGSGYNKLLFKGVFYAFSWNKTFSGVTQILPDKMEKLFGGLGSLVQKINSSANKFGISWDGRDPLVKFDNKDFEKEYVVYSDNEMEARSIISEPLMIFLLELKKNTNAKIYISFVGNKIFLGISDNKDILKVGNINESVTDNGFLQKYLIETEACIVIARKIVNILKIR